MSAWALAPGTPGAQGALAHGHVLTLAFGLAAARLDPTVLLQMFPADIAGLICSADRAPAPADLVRADRQFPALPSVIPFALVPAMLAAGPACDWQAPRSGRIALLDRVLAGAEPEARLPVLPGSRPRLELAVVIREDRAHRSPGCGMNRRERLTAPVPLLPEGWTAGAPVPAPGPRRLPPFTDAEARRRLLAACVAGWPRPARPALRQPLPDPACAGTAGLDLASGAVDLRPVADSDSGTLCALAAGLARGAALWSACAAAVRTWGVVAAIRRRRLLATGSKA